MVRKFWSIVESGNVPKMMKVIEQGTPLNLFLFALVLPYAQRSNLGEDGCCRWVSEFGEQRGSHAPDAQCSASQIFNLRLVGFEWG